MTKIDTVLLVDDDEVANYLNFRMITALNISRKLEVRKSGKEAIDYLMEYDKAGELWPGLIFLDLQMPDMDGRQFLEEFQKLANRSVYGTKIVLLSATMHPSCDKICEHYNIKHFLVKPLTPNKLREIIV